MVQRPQVQMRGSMATRTVRGVVMSIHEELVKEITKLGAMEVLDYHDPSWFPDRNLLSMWKQARIKKCIYLIKQLGE